MNWDPTRLRTVSPVELSSSSEGFEADPSNILSHLGAGGTVTPDEAIGSEKLGDSQGPTRHPCLGPLRIHHSASPYPHPCFQNPGQGPAQLIFIGPLSPGRDGTAPAEPHYLTGQKPSSRTQSGARPKTALPNFCLQHLCRLLSPPARHLPLALPLPLPSDIPNSALASGLPEQVV